MKPNNRKIPFNIPLVIGKEFKYIKKVLESRRLSGDGFYTSRCSKFLEELLHTKKAFLTTSGSSALDISAILMDIKKKDEIIMPSFTFVSTANAFISRGAIIRFADIREDTLNIDESKIERLITTKTKSIVVVHYAGIPCEMDKINNIAKKNNLYIIEDGAQGFYSQYKSKFVGSLGDLGCFSFHETKNITCGEGGAILINNEKFIERTEIIREKGTNRSKFFRGEIDKYSWVDIGSSYLPSEILAAFLFAQLEESENIIFSRRKSWDYYNDNLEDLEEKGLARRPIVPNFCKHNGHLFYLLLNSEVIRDKMINYLKHKNITAVFHYLPLHSSIFWQKTNGGTNELKITEKMSACLIRLPLYYGITKDDQDIVIEAIKNFFKT
jgi:dTDP-4-amino-4,6-dideoxygalactose transaminase